MLQVKVYFMIGASNGRSTGSTRSATPDGEHRLGANRSRAFLCATLRRKPMTPILLLLAFLLMLDVLILLGPSTTRETAGTGSRAAYPRLARRPLRPSDDQTSS